jgi:hypothetical protein
MHKYEIEKNLESLNRIVGDTNSVVINRNIQSSIWTSEHE